jgi:GAF domain-containing protein/HAMP domain-containing protein
MMRVFNSLNLTLKLMVPIGILAFVLLGVFGYITYQQRLESARRESRILAESVQRQIEAVRAYYTANVVSTALRAGLDVASAYHASESPAIPLPATFVREMSEGLNATATDTQYLFDLLSLYPVNPEKGPRSDAERQFMELNFQEGTAQESTITLNGNEFYALYAPDFANAETCVACHNSLEGSPKRDYQLNDVMGSLIIRVPMAERLNLVNRDTLLQLGLFSLVLVIAGVVFYALSRRTILTPMSEMAGAVRQFASGDFNRRTLVRSSDEVGLLASGFNNMADQLQDLVSSLEERVNFRTRDLRTIADVNQQISTILNVDRLLQDVVDLTKERFRLYHAHIYVMDEKGETLILTSGAGNVGRKMVSEGRQIAADNPQSIVARAATTRKPVTVQDVRQSPTFLPHPLLPDTRSELAVPLVARGQLLGVLDVQSDVANYFDTDVIGVVELLAGQVASALSNASLYEIADRTSRHERALGSIDRRIQAAADVDEILQVAVRELGKALRVPHTAVQLRMGESASEPN